MAGDYGEDYGGEDYGVEPGGADDSAPLPADVSGVNNEFQNCWGPTGNECTEQQYLCSVIAFSSFDFPVVLTFNSRQIFHSETEFSHHQ